MLILDKVTEAIFVIPIAFRLKVVPCSCHCGHNEAVVLLNGSQQIMIGCNECSGQAEIVKVIKQFVESQGHNVI